LSKDGESLILTNKRPNDKNDYILESDPHTAQDQMNKRLKNDLKEIQKFQRSMSSGFSRLSGMLTGKKQDEVEELSSDLESSIDMNFLDDNTGLENERTLKCFVANKKLFLKVSEASCKLSDIEGIVYGGFSSRFWIFRKHINSMAKTENGEMPFYAWECVTLILNKGREIDLVIVNETRMMQFLKLISYKINSYNGNKNSA